MTLAPLVALGFLLGIRHALDADHLVAVSTILTRERTVRRAASIGLLWGLGHSLTILVVGGLIVAVQWAVPPRVELLLELPVALMLIILGVRSIGTALPPRGHDHSNARTTSPHDHVHVHGDYIHSHGHGHGKQRHGHDERDNPVERLDRWLDHRRTYQTLRPVVVGVVHGLAGSAAVALLVLPMVDSTWGALSYLLLFGMGTILGMSTVTVVIAFPLTAGDAVRWVPLRMVTTWVVGVISIGFGLLLGTEILTSL